MRLAEIVLRNWMRFRGEHVLKLEAKAYAVVAHGTDNAERSNWLGKTSLLEAVDFGLWGRHRHRTEDEWISNGEAIGEVKLVFDSGAYVIRNRERGKRTTLHFHGPEVKNGAMQDEAQKIVREIVGLDGDDFLATCYFQQRHMARLILADPGTRMEMVSGWLRLGPLERCDEKVKADVSTLGEQARQMEAQLQSLAEMEKHALDGGTRKDIEDFLSEAASVLETRRGQYATAQDAVTKNATLLAAQSRVEDFDALFRDGKALKAEIAQSNGGKLKKEYEALRIAEVDCTATCRAAKAQLDEKRGLSKGEFDGVCPVAGIDCPAKEDINKDRKRGLKLFDEARTVLATAEETYAKVRDEAQTSRAALQEYERKESKLAAMRDQAARLEPEYEKAKKGGEPTDPVVLRQRLDDAARRLDETMEGEKTLRVRLDQIDQIDRRRETMEKGLAELRKRLATYREASVVFGKQGAQRRVAEGALGEIEDGANGMLRESGMDLSVAVRWSREGSGLARACDACGNPFPASVKVKVCSRCHAGRGPLLINKLDFALSDRSGAAEDLGGVALQLSASAWLRGERGSLWETALLDEPFGQLDGANRKALGRHLAALLAGRYGFSQALVVAHSPDVLGALPGRIEIEGGPTGSTVRVVA